MARRNDYFYYRGRRMVRRRRRGRAPSYGANIARATSWWKEEWKWKDEKGVWRKRTVFGEGKVGF